MEKKICRNVIISLIFAIAMIVASYFAIDTQRQIEYAERSVTAAQYDFLINDPSVEQVNQIANEQSVDSVFPVFNYSLDVSGSKMAKGIRVLFAKDMTYANNSIFSDDMVINGDIDYANGVTIDKTAAEKLGAKVGDNISYDIKGRTYTEKVVAIVTPSASKVDSYKSGVMLSSLANMASQVFVDESYNLAFIKSNNIAETNQYLQSYIPYGRMQSKIDFSKQYDVEHTRFDETDQEWNKKKEVAYQKYCDEYKASFAGQQTSLSGEDMFLISDTAKQKTSVLAIEIATAVLSTIAYLILQVCFVLHDKKSTLQDINDAAYLPRIIRDKCIVSAVAPLAIAVLSLVCGVVIAAVLFDLSTVFMSLVLTISMPICICVILLPLIIYISYKSVLTEHTPVKPEKRDGDKSGEVDVNDNQMDIKG